MERTKYFFINFFYNLYAAVPDLPLCLGVIKHRSPLASGRGVIFLPKSFFTMDFCLCGAILNLQAFCFGAIPDIMIELIVYGSVLQSRQSWQWPSGIKTKLLGGLWLLAKQCLRWIHAYVVQFWIEKGPSECQHWDGHFTTSKRA